MVSQQEEPKIYCSVCKKLLQEIVEHHKQKHNFDWPDDWSKKGDKDE